MIFGASRDVSGLPTSENQLRVQNTMMKAWAAFADDPAHGLEERLKWPKYDPNGESDFS